MLDINEYLRIEGPSEIDIAELGEDVATARRLVALLREKVGEVNDVLAALAGCSVEVSIDQHDDYPIGSLVPTTILFVRDPRLAIEERS